MIIFREHRGMFEDSMATAKEFEDVSELIEYLDERFGLCGKELTLGTKEQSDKRNNWKDTKDVIISIDGVQQLVGMYATDY